MHGGERAQVAAGDGEEAEVGVLPLHPGLCRGVRECDAHRRREGKRQRQRHSILHRGASLHSPPDTQLRHTTASAKESDVVEYADCEALCSNRCSLAGCSTLHASQNGACVLSAGRCLCHGPGTTHRHLPDCSLTLPSGPPIPPRRWHHVKAWQSCTWLGSSPLATRC